MKVIRERDLRAPPSRLARARAEYESVKERVPPHTRGRVALLGIGTFLSMVLIGGAGGAMVLMISLVVI